jgi:peroxiredoxin
LALFVDRARVVHGDKYDYSTINWDVTTTKQTKVAITCQVHGVFLKSAAEHIQSKVGCPGCSTRQKYTSKENFVARARAIHGDKYDYSSVEWQNGMKAITKVAITCPAHGVFVQRISEHAQAEHGCYKCHKTPTTHSLSGLLTRFVGVHGNKYDYSSVVWTPDTNLQTKVTIICKDHGAFQQAVGGHTKGRGCQSCAGQERYSSVDNIVKRAHSIHGNRYDYSRVEWTDTTNAASKITIICTKHGEFTQRIGDHISDSNGCPKCKASRGEVAIGTWLDNYKVRYNQEHKFPNCRNPGTGKQLRFDFYLPDHNTCIEFHGGQHYKPFDFVGGRRKQAIGSTRQHKPSEASELEFHKSLERDRIKAEYCNQNGIRLLVIPYTELPRVSEILKREVSVHDGC